MVQPKASSYSVQGARHIKNDDFSLVNQEQGIYVICDGISEGGQGHLASQLVSKKIHEKLIEANAYLKKQGPGLQGSSRLQVMQESILNAFTYAQECLQNAGQSDPLYRSAYTTCITLWMDGRFAILAHIGDSRAYLYRAGKVYQITKDHSALDELIKGGMAPEVAAKNPLANALIRAFGAGRYSLPDVLKIEFQPNDLLFLCTDGVYSALQGASLQQFVHGMVQGTDMKSYIEKCAHASGDDSTMIEIHFPEGTVEEAPLQASDRIKLIQQTPLAKYLDYIQQSHVAAICNIEVFKAGSVIVQEETEGECMYIIAKGTLEILLKGQHIAYMNAGHFMGEVGLIQKHSKRTATAIAKEDTVLLSLKGSDLQEAFKKDLGMERHFYRAMLESVMARMIEQGREIAHLKKL